MDTSYRNHSLSLSGNYQKYVKECKKDEDAVCECVDGYYCLYPDCEHCQQARQCPEGEGVKVRGRLTL